MAKIKFRNFWIWFSDQVKRKTFIRNFFITRNAWGAFSINSHINQHTGQPKVTYNTVETARKSAEKMGARHNTHFSYYKCLFCDGYHIGKFGARPIVWYATKEWAESCSPQDNDIADPIEWDGIDDEGYKNVCAPPQYESIK